MQDKVGRIEALRTPSGRSIGHPEMETVPDRCAKVRTRPAGRQIAFLLLVPLLGMLSGAARAAPAIEILLRGIAPGEDRGGAAVELRILNPDDITHNVTLPDRIEARLDNGSEKGAIFLTRASDTPASIPIAAHGFAEARYRLPQGDVSREAMLSIPAWSSQTIPVGHTAPPPSAPVPLATGPDAGAAINGERPAPPPTDRAAGNLFLDNLSPYEPIYAVYGPGTNTEARIQISFKYKLFGTLNPSTEPQGLHLAYTQRMFWDLATKSSPFRNIDYQPELFYVARPIAVAGGITLAAHAGFRHESNGREGLDSRSINSLYVAPMAAIPLGGGYRLSVAPRLSVYVGDKSDNPDIVRYRGHTGLLLEVGKDHGIRLSTSTRFNPRSGKGAINADLSYPLPLLLGGGADIYLFAQSFAGYGENLLDYDRRTTRLRFGFALVR